MAEHNLFLGGQRTNNPGYNMFPSVEMGPDDHYMPDGRNAPVWHSPTRRLVWKGESCCTKAENSSALIEYLDCNVIEVGDILNITAMVKETSLYEVWVKVLTPLTGFTFDLQVRGNAASLGGTTAAPVTQPIAAGVDGATAGSSLTVLPAPMYFDQNDMLQLVVTGLPVEGIKCSDILVAASIKEYCRGFN